ncbi:hypothetical protein BS50DRAFT_60798 [Corynespora cassiicola Philippines]|uniref:Protein BIG1 n=1 Tax=Corynespora cassiicola Philippines TaxID=1448308 RepID=A0A2T2NJV1_CORCC|nr:hypothetical protein BS50DRAFT_60798 [Corynespora cassiicola Philippines]
MHLLTMFLAIFFWFSFLSLLINPNTSSFAYEDSYIYFTVVQEVDAASVHRHSLQSLWQYQKLNTTSTLVLRQADKLQIERPVSDPLNPGAKISIDHPNPMGKRKSRKPKSGHRHSHDYKTPIPTIQTIIVTLPSSVVTVPPSQQAFPPQGSHPPFESVVLPSDGKTKIDIKNLFKSLPTNANHKPSLSYTQKSPSTVSKHYHWVSCVLLLPVVFLVYFLWGQNVVKTPERIDAKRDWEEQKEKYRREEEEWRLAEEEEDKRLEEASSHIHN